MKKGFTLIEIIIIIMVMVILVAVAIPKFAELRKRAEQTEKKRRKAERWGNSLSDKVSDITMEYDNSTNQIKFTVHKVDGSRSRGYLYVHDE